MFSGRGHRNHNSGAGRGCFTHGHLRSLRVRTPGLVMVRAARSTPSWGEPGKGEPRGTSKGAFGELSNRTYNDPLQFDRGQLFQEYAAAEPAGAVAPLYIPKCRNAAVTDHGSNEVGAQFLSDDRAYRKRERPLQAGRWREVRRGGHRRKKAPELRRPRRVNGKSADRQAEGKTVALRCWLRAGWRGEAMGFEGRGTPPEHHANARRSTFAH